MGVIVLDEIVRALLIRLRLNSGTDVGSRRRINLIEGTNIDITIADDADDDELDVQIAASAHAPATHALGGAYHSAATLAELNAKVSDATLDDSSAARTPSAHAASHVAGDPIQDTSPTQKGIVELAVASEINTGTSTALANSPDALAGSNFGIRYFQMVCFDWTTDTAVGDGKFYAHVPPGLNGMNLVYCHAEVVTAGTTNTLDIQIHNLTQAADMLSTVMTVDTGETGSDTAATPYVIDTNEDDLATNDVLRVDVDAVHTTAAKGLIVTLGFQLA